VAGIWGDKSLLRDFVTERRGLVLAHEFKAHENLNIEYDRLREEALAVAWSRLKIIEKRGVYNSKIGRMNGVFYGRLLDAAFAYQSPGYCDWPYYADDARFRPALLDYLTKPAAVARLQANGVSNLADLVFGMLGNISGGYIERKNFRSPYIMASCKFTEPWSIEPMLSPTLLHSLPSVRAIISDPDAVFVIPTFQRPYAWGDKQLKDLRQDLCNALNNPPPTHYFAHIHIVSVNSWSALLDKSNTALAMAIGHIGAGNIGQLYAVVDGQQRLVTLYLLSILQELLVPSAVLPTPYPNLFKLMLPGGIYTG